MQLKTRIRLRPPLGAIAAHVVAALTTITLPGGAQTLSPYSDFQAMSLADMDSVRIKLTYGGPQDHLLATLVVVRNGASPSIVSFTPFRRSGFEYSNDDGPIGTVGASRQDLKAIIDNVGTLPRVTAGGVDPNGYVSFALMSTIGGTIKVFESIVNDTTGRDLFGQTLRALTANAEATRDVRRLGCDVAMMPQDPPTDVGGQVTVTFGGLRADRSAKGHFVGKVKVTNHSASAVPAPVTLLVIRTGGNAALVDDDGVTCVLQPKGVAYVNLDVGSGLAAGASVEKVLHFANPSQMKFDVSFRAVAGPGTR